MSCFDIRKNFPILFPLSFRHLRYEAICFLADNVQYNSKIHKKNITKMTVQESVS